MAEPKYIKAYEDHKAGMKQGALAKKYKVAIPTVKSWAARYFRKWDAEARKNAEKDADIGDNIDDGMQTGMHDDCGIDANTPVITVIEEHNVHPVDHKSIDMPPIGKVTKREVTLADIESVLVDDDYKTLEPRRREFIDEYILNGHNATNAYVKAYGVGRGTAGVQGCRLINDPKIARIIDVKIAERSAAAHVDADYVLINSKEVVARCMQASPVMVFDKAQRKYVQATSKDGRPQWQFDSKGANQALDLISKILGITIDRKQIDVRQTVEDYTPDERERRIKELEKRRVIDVDSIIDTSMQ